MSFSPSKEPRRSVSIMSLPPLHRSYRFDLEPIRLHFQPYFVSHEAKPEFRAPVPKARRTTFPSPGPPAAAAATSLLEPKTLMAWERESLRAISLTGLRKTVSGWQTPPAPDSPDVMEALPSSSSPSSLTQEGSGAGREVSRRRQRRPPPPAAAARICVNCGTGEGKIWRNNDPRRRGLLCNACGKYVWQSKGRQRPSSLFVNTLKKND